MASASGLMRSSIVEPDRRAARFRGDVGWVVGAGLLPLVLIEALPVYLVLLFCGLIGALVLLFALRASLPVRLHSGARKGRRRFLERSLDLGRQGSVRMHQRFRRYPITTISVDGGDAKALRVEIAEVVRHLEALDYEVLDISDDVAGHPRFSATYREIEKWQS